MKPFEGFLTELEREISHINNHMPRAKKTLRQLLQETAPSFTTRDGQMSAVRREELDYLASLIPSDYHDEIRLPFIILRRTSLGPGAHTIGGTKLEQFIIFRVLGTIDAPFRDWRVTRLPRFIYSPEVAILRRKLPTTTVVGFGV